MAKPHKARINLNVASDVHEILADVSAKTGKPRVGKRPSTGTSASQYVESVVRDSEAEWRIAAEQMEARGWPRIAIGVACELLSDVIDGELRPRADIGDVMADRLADAERTTHEATRAEIGLDYDGWLTLAETARDPFVAAALYLLAREWAVRRNPRLQRFVRGGE